MQSLHHIFQRAVLALALLASGLAGGYALHDPDAARASSCRSEAAMPAASVPQPIYAAVWTASGAHAACSCGSV
ncbi:MAG TPA: hypothetical protein VJ806_05725 [Luteimonas sp.]|nr:hypothetical protein [Luteimonas sp.]